MSKAQAEATGASAPMPWIERQLAQLQGRQGHAWLMHGAAGLGQLELGMAVVSAWLCDTPGPSGACGACQSCHAISVHTHPDLMRLVPETQALTLDWPISERDMAEIQAKRRKPSAEIRVDAMRDLVEFAQRTASRARGKAVLIYPAERMNGIAANTLLKTLEEPAGDTRFVLLSEASHRLLPTIRSRCLGVPLQEPPTDEADAWLRAQGVGAADATVLLRAAGGRPTAAWRMAQNGQGADFWRRLPQAVARQDIGAFSGLAAASLIDALQKLCHDLMRVAAGGEPRFLDAQTLPKPRPLPVLERWAEQLSESARHASHPLQPTLLQESLVGRAHRAVHSAEHL